MTKRFLTGSLLCISMLLATHEAMAFCWKEAADPYRQYGVNESLLKVIAMQESGMNPSAMHYNAPGGVNRRGSWDIGFMQINDGHLSRLRKYGVTAATLKTDACVNLKVGAWILAEAMHHYQGAHNGFWQAVGAYNAGHDPKLQWRRNNYAWQIYHRMKKMALNGEPGGFERASVRRNGA